MNLEIFKKENELNQGIGIEECKNKIKEYIKKQEYITDSIETFENDFVKSNKKIVNKFLTEELNFIENYINNEEIYNFESDGHRYKIVVNFYDFNKRGFVNFYNSKSKEYSFVCEYNEMTFDKIYWEIDKYCGEQLTQKGRKTLQDNKKFWNEEMKKVEDAYNNNLKLLDKMKSGYIEENFNIVVDEDNDEVRYSDLKEFIKIVLENM